MADEDAPDPRGDNWFTDTQELGQYMEDHRLADTRMNSSFEDAQSVIAAFGESTEAGAWPSLDRAEVAGRLATLIAPTAQGDAGTGYRSMDQGELNLCGPAAFLVLAIGRDPAAVARYATELFDTGTGSIGGFSVTAGDDLRNADFAAMTARGRISSQAEWMMLSAIRNSTEVFWQPDWNGDPDQELAGMSRPEELADWMRQTGIWSSVEDAGRWASNPGIPDATSLSVAEGTDTVMLIHGNLLSEGTFVGDRDGMAQHQWSLLEYFPNHWVVLLSEVTPDVHDGSLQFSLWTYGHRFRMTVPQQVFLDNYFGTVSASL